MSKRFTGWHMLAILVGCFGIVVAVNVTMAIYASRTFGGTVVDNSYVASQRYNGWLEEARRQAALGWTETIERRDDRIVLRAESSLGPLEGATVAARAAHPLGRTGPVTLGFEEVGEGVYRSREALPEGRWQVQIEIVRGAERKRIVKDIG